MTNAPRFRVLLTLVFGVLCLVMTGGLSIGLMTFVQQRLAAEQHAALDTLARSTSTMFAEGLYERLREVQLLAEGPELRRAGPEAGPWRPLLARMQASRPQFAWIGVTDASGIVKVATGGLLEGQDVSARPWFKGALAGPYTGDVHPAKLLADKLPRGADGEPMRFVDFAAPLHDPQGRLVGVVGVHGSWDWAGSVIGRMRGERSRDRGILVYVLDAQGNVIHRPSGPEGAEAVPQRLLAAGAPPVLRWADGRDYLTSIARVEAGGVAAGLGWQVVVRQPVEVALQVAHQAGQAALLIGLAISLLGLGCVWWQAGRLSAPLGAITRAALRIRDGELDARIPDERRIRETRELSQSLRAMTEALMRQRAELEQSNHDLERRVAERTAELQEASAELARLARHDPLTGLYNRRAADERLLLDTALYQRHGTPFGVLLIDIDHFKRINDQHGHGAGDAVLAEVARRLRDCCRASDHVCRWGGEEFLVLLAHTDAGGALAVAEKIRTGIAALPIEPVETVTVSIGVAVPEPGLADGPALVKAADEALYGAKRAGRNRVGVAAAAVAV